MKLGCQSPARAITVFRRHNKPALGPLDGDAAAHM
jgi:hypothetical protein